MNYKSGKTCRQKGFTLVEIMVVVVIIGMLAALVAPSMLGQQAEAQIEKAKTDLVSIHGVIEMYALRNNRIPDSIDELIVEDESGMTYLEGYEEAPEDPWGNAYEIRVLEGYRKFEVISWGQDGEPDTDDDLSSMKKK